MSNSLATVHDEIDSQFIRRLRLTVHRCFFYHQYGFCMYGGIGTWPVLGYVVGSINFDWQGFPSLINNGTATLLGEHPLPLASTLSVAARFVLYLWFWNQIFTCVGVSRMIEARCSLSGALKYLCCRKRLSSSNVCAFENNTRLFRFLCSVSCGCASFACCSSSKSADSSSLHSWFVSCFGGNERSEIVGLVESGCCNTAILNITILLSKLNVRFSWDFLVELAGTGEFRSIDERYESFSDILHFDCKKIRRFAESCEKRLGDRAMRIGWTWTEF